MKKEVFKSVLFDYLENRGIKDFFYFDNFFLNVSFKKDNKFNSKKILFNNTSWFNKTIIININEFDLKSNFFIRKSKNTNREKIILKFCKNIILITKKIISFKKNKILIPINIDSFYKKTIKNSFIFPKNIKIKAKKTEYFVSTDINNIKKTVNILQKMPGIIDYGFFKIIKKKKVILINEEEIIEF